MEEIVSAYPSITESPLRDRAVVDAVRKCIAEGRPPSFGFVSEICAPLFEDLGSDELEIAVAWVNSETVRSGGEVQPSEPDTVDLRETWAPETISEPVPVDEVIAVMIEGQGGTSPHDRNKIQVEAIKREIQGTERAQLHDTIVALNKQVQILQGDKVTAEQYAKDAREDLARAVFQWQTRGGQKNKYGREQLIRDHLKANFEYKLAVAEGRIIPPPQPRTAQGTYRDRVGAWRGDANDFVRRYQGQHGQSVVGQTVHKGDARGAYPKSALGRVVRPPTEG